MFVKASITIILIFFSGVLCGYYNYIPQTITSFLLTASIVVILFCGGATIGLNKTAITNIRYYGIRAIMLPLFTAISVLLCNALLWVVYLDIPLYNSLAVASGFAYYSLSSAIVEKLFSTELATLVLLTNMFLEIWALLFAPLFAWIFGPLAPIAVSGVSAMDICLPVIMRTSGKEYFVYAAIHGMMMTLLSPLCIYLFYFLSRL